MLMQRIPKLVALWLLATCLVAQSDLRGPLGGFVYDGARQAIRPLLGVPGASYLGEAVVASLDSAWIAPDGKQAVAAARGRLWLIRGLDTGEVRWTELERGTADRAAWAEDAGAVALYSKEGGWLRVWSDLGAGGEGAAVRPSVRGRQTIGRRDGAPGPRLTRLGNLSSLGGTVAAMAVNERREVVVGMESPASGGIYLARGEQAPRLIARLGAPGGIALDGNRLFVTDRARDEVLEVRDYRDGADVSLFADAGRGMRDPVAVALSKDGATLIVASGAERRLDLVDIATRAPAARIDLDFEPTRLERLGVGAVFLLNSRGAPTETLQVLAAGRRPAVYFVPAGPATAAAQTTPGEE